MWLLEDQDQSFVHTFTIIHVFVSCSCFIFPLARDRESLSDSNLDTLYEDCKMSLLTTATRLLWATGDYNLLRKKRHLLTIKHV